MTRSTCADPARASGVAHEAIAAQLIDAHGDYIYGYCRRLLGNDAEADDVSQTVFVQALAAAHELPQIDQPRAWLTGIARYRCIDVLRARRRAPAPLDERELELAVDAAATLGAEDPRVRGALDHCLDRLDARSRAVLVLRFHDELPYEEIGAQLADKVGALRVRVTRALSALRRCLERKGVMR